VQLRFPTVTGRRIRVTVTGVRIQSATRESTGDTVTAPAAIAELGIPGLRVASAPAALPGDCRSDLLTIDGRSVPVRITGRTSAASSIAGLAVTPCDPRDPSRVPTITLARGDHVVRTSDGIRTGLQLDRVVLASAAGGEPLAVARGRVTGLGTTPPPTPTVAVVHNGATRLRVHVSGADAPFWLVLGESQSDGWKATIAHRGSLGGSLVVDGYANGWLVRPTSSSFDVVLEWTPQRRVWAALWISVLAALFCLAIAGWTLIRRRTLAADARPDPTDAEATLEWPSRPRGGVGAGPTGDGPTRARLGTDRVVLPVLAGLAASLIVAPWVGAIVVVVVVLIQWRPPLRAFLALAPAVLLALVMVYIVYLQHRFRFPAVFEWPTLFPLGRPLGWLAVVFLGVDVLVERVRAPPPRPGSRTPESGDSRER
jgi:hypothetical protein